MALGQQSMPGKNIIGCKFSVQNDWLINCKFAARYTSEQNAIKLSKVMQLKSATPMKFGFTLLPVKKN